MFFDSSEFEFIKQHESENDYDENVKFQKKTKNTSYMWIVMKEDQKQEDVFEQQSECMPELNYDEYEQQHQFMPDFEYEQQSEFIPELVYDEDEQQSESTQEQELTPVRLIKQVHIKYDSKKHNSEKRYNRGKLHYLTTEEKIIRRRELNRLYAANSRSRKQQLKQQELQQQELEQQELQQQQLEIELKQQLEQF